MKPVLGVPVGQSGKNVLEQRSQISSIYLTRMHSSRMRTIRCSDRLRVGSVYPNMHWTGVCVSQHALGRGVCVRGGGLVYPVGGCPGGVCVQGVCMCVSQGCVFWGVCPGACVCPGECFPQCMLGYTLCVNRMTDRCL